MDLEQLCKGIAENLDPLKGQGVQVAPFLLGDPNPPAVEVIPGDEEYHQAYQDGRTEAEFKVRVFVATAAAGEEAQRRLFRFMAHTGPESVKELIEAGDGLDGLARALKVSGRTGPRSFSRPGGAPLIGAEWTVVLWL